VKAYKLKKILPRSDSSPFSFTIRVYSRRAADLNSDVSSATIAAADISWHQLKRLVGKSCQIEESWRQIEVKSSLKSSQDISFDKIENLAGKLVSREFDLRAIF
jgi:hypothetical protein